MVKLNKIKKAFTLAELLVAMMIFGVIASLLIPNVAQNAEKNLFITQLKKVQNDVQQAFLVMISENQGSLQAFCAGGQDSSCFINEISRRLETKVTFGETLTNEENDTCVEDNKDEKNACIQQEAYLDRSPILLDKRTSASFIINSSNANNPYKVANLTNGASVSAFFNHVCDKTTYSFKGSAGGSNTSVNLINVDENTRVCGYMEIDINASKAPNMVGKDIHYFWIVDRDGLVPFGEIDDTSCGNDKTLSIGADLSDYNKPDKDSTVAQQLGCTFKLIQDNKILYY